MARGELLYYNENKAVVLLPGSSTVEHLAVNCTAEDHKPLFWRRLATTLSPLIVPQLCPTTPKFQAVINTTNQSHLR